MTYSTKLTRISTVVFSITSTIMLTLCGRTYTGAKLWNLALFPVCLMRKPHGRHAPTPKKYGQWPQSSIAAIRGGITNLYWDHVIRRRKEDEYNFQAHDPDVAPRSGTVVLGEENLTPEDRKFWNE